MILTWSIAAETVPPGRWEDVYRLCSEAWDIWAKSVHGVEVQFVADPVDAWCSMGFHPLPLWPDRIAQASKRPGGRPLIEFDPRVKWRFRWWQGLFSWGSVDLLPLALHEIGHALGLPHSAHPGSIMFPRPTLHYVDDLSAAYVQETELFNPDD